MDTKQDSYVGWIEGAVYWLSRMANIVSGVALIALMGLTFLNVVLRSVWTPILGTYEFTGFLAAVTISMALAHCAVKQGHVAITLVTDHLPERLRAICETITAALGAALYLVLGWQCCKYAMHIMNSGEVSETTETPFYLFIYLVAYGLILLAMVLVIDFVKSFKKVFK